MSAVDNNTLVIVGAVAIHAAALTWFIATQFSNTRKLVYKVVKDHETEDNRRHEENLTKFTKLTLQIAKLRWHLKIPDTSADAGEGNGG